MQTIGSRVKSLRIGKKLSQQELADLVGISQPTVAKIESNRTKNMEGFTLETLARELSTTTTYILLGSTNELDHEHEVFQAEMAAVFRQLSLPDKETLLRMARGLLP